MVYDALLLGKMVSKFQKIVASSAVYEVFEPEARPRTRYNNQDDFDLQQNRCKTLKSHTNKKSST